MDILWEAPLGGGAYFDGTGTDVIVCDIPNTLLYEPRGSVIIDFTPEFPADDGVYRTLIYSNNHNYFASLKTSTNILYSRWGYVWTSSSGFSSYWKEGQRNVLVSRESGSTYRRVFLNGEIIVSNASTPTNTYINQLFIGASDAAGNNPFLGTIHSIKIIREECILEDAQALYNRSLYDFSDANAYHNFNAVKNGEAIGSDRYGLPTDIKDCEWTGDSLTLTGAADEYATITGSQVTDNSGGGITVGICFSPDYEPGGFTQYLWGAIDSIGYRVFVGSSGVIGWTESGTSRVIALADYKDYWRVGGKNTLIAAQKDGTDNSDLYFNGYLLLTTTHTHASEPEVMIGARYDAVALLRGQIHSFTSIPRKLGVLDVKRLDKQLRGSLPNPRIWEDIYWQFETSELDVDLIIRADSGARWAVDYGDGTFEEYTGTGANQDVSHTYTSPGTRTVTVVIDDDTQLERFYCSLSDFTGSLPDLSANTSLKYFVASSNSFEGTIPDLSANTSLTLYWVNDCNLTGYTASTLSATMDYFRVDDNALSLAAVDQILTDAARDLNDAVAGTLRLEGGTNATPTPSVLAAANAALPSWDIRTN